jgi:pimeloyl-ACP methyl ester carboxylesterase
MRVSVGDLRLFVDVDGLEWVADAEAMRRRPTAIVLHGGPGLDSAFSKASFGFLREVAQVVYFDHRGNGRSDLGEPEKWTLAQWGDDVYCLCEALGIERPVVIGTSFGGLVAMSYAVRHPDHAAALVLVATAAHDCPVETVVEAFRRLGGDEVGDIVKRDLTHSTAETSELFVQRALPLLSQSPDGPAKLAELTRRCIRRQEVELRFTNGESRTYDFRRQLDAVRCPTLVIGGGCDPIFPEASFAELREALPDRLVEAHLIEDAGHSISLDAPERFQQLVSEFTERHAPG